VNLRKAFDALDWLGRGFLTSNEFKRAFDWHVNMNTSNASFRAGSLMRGEACEMEALLRRFNKDKMNGRVSLPEFMEELTPKESERNY